MADRNEAIRVRSWICANPSCAVRPTEVLVPVTADIPVAPVLPATAPRGVCRVMAVRMAHPAMAAVAIAPRAAADTLSEVVGGIPRAEVVDTLVAEVTPVEAITKAKRREV